MLRGEKVTLRAFRRDDLPRWHEFLNDVEVELLSGGDPPRPQTLESLERRFNEKMMRDGGNSANFAVEADAKLIGYCTLSRFDTLSQTCELGIVIGDRAYWGRGYGREATNLLLDYAFRMRNFRKVWLTVSATNERAYRAYRACGFVEEGRLRAHVWNNGQYIDLVYMGILRDEWVKRPTVSSAHA